MFKQRKFVSSKGKEYTLQFPGIRKVTQIRDRAKNKHGVPSDERIADDVLEHVVVSPKMRIEDFGDDIGEFNEVIGAAVKFINGIEDDPDDQSTGS